MHREPAVPEILVVGTRTQNQDIRRTENDIQAYQVFGRQEIRTSLSGDVGTFLRDRLSSNAIGLSPSQNPAGNSGANRSEVNLRGLGTNQTLVLVDGARMPSVPAYAGDLSILQPDLNGVPLFMIDRIETLTATAGGIYGPGATGGTINVVLKRDYRGADLNLTGGMSDRGDATYRRIDARLGFTPDHGRTGVMLGFSQTTNSRLTAGDRDFATAARALYIASNRDFLVRYPFPPVDGIVIKGTLTLKPSFGGGSLAGAYTYLPASYSGSARDLVSVLARNAGTLPSTLPADGNGTGTSLTNGARTTSVLATVRHRFGDSVEAFVDFIGYRNEGSAYGAQTPSLSCLQPRRPVRSIRMSPSISRSRVSTASRATA